MPNNAEKIASAMQAATTPGVSPGKTLHAIMAALGQDFGDPEQVEADVMQFYADPENNPFVQARIEARLLVDAGHLERLAGLCKNHNFHPWEINKLWLASQDLSDSARESLRSKDPFSKMLLPHLTRAIVHAIFVSITGVGVNQFNHSLGQAIGEFEAKLPKDEA